MITTCLRQSPYVAELVRNYYAIAVKRWLGAFKCVSMKHIITLSNICHERLNAPWGEQ
jgi:hypothetical protein